MNTFEQFEKTKDPSFGASSKIKKRYVGIIAIIAVCVGIGAVFVYREIAPSISLFPENRLDARIETKKIAVLPIDAVDAVPYFFAMSPDGGRFAYLRGVIGDAFYVVDGVEQKHYEGVGILYFFGPQYQSFLYTAREDGKLFVVVN